MKRRVIAAVTGAALLGCLPGICSAMPQSSPAKGKPRTQTSDGKPSPQELLERAASAAKANDFTSALAALKQYAETQPADAVVQFQIGYASSQLGKMEEAKAAYRKAVELDAKLAPAYINLGLLEMENEPVRAVESFQHAAELQPDKARPRYLLGRALERAGEPDRAVDAFRAAIDLEGANFDLHFALGRVYLATKEFAEAEAEFRAALALTPESAPGRLALAEALEAQKKLGAAAEELAAYVRLQPEDWQGRFRLAAILAEAGQSDAALAEIEGIDQAGKSSGETWKLRGEIYIRKEQLDAAIGAFEQAGVLAPRDAELRAHLGRLYLEKREFPKAERELRAALSVDASLSDAIRDLLSTYYLAEQYGAALQVMDELEKKEPPTAGTWFIRGVCYDKLQKLPEAIAAYRQFLAMDEGKNENQEIQARHRIPILEKELERKKR